MVGQQPVRLRLLELQPAQRPFPSALSVLPVRATCVQMSSSQCPSAGLLPEPGQSLASSTTVSARGPVAGHSWSHPATITLQPTWVLGAQRSLLFLLCCRSPLRLCVSSSGFHCSMESRACALPIMLTELARPLAQGLRRTHQCGHQLSPQHSTFPSSDVVYGMTENFLKPTFNLRPTSRNSQWPAL